MTRLAALAFAVVLGTAPALAQDLGGVYATEGVNPGGGGGYTGQTVIEQTGATYRVSAEVGTSAVGTGVFLDGVLSVMFPDQGWIASYALQSDGSLRGIWAQSGDTAIGQETLTPIR